MPERDRQRGALIRVRARKIAAHDGVPADARLSFHFRRVRGVAARLFRAQYAPADQRADHPHRQHAKSAACANNTTKPASGGWCCSSICVRAGRDRAFIWSPRRAGRGLPAMSARSSPACSTTRVAGNLLSPHRSDRRRRASRAGAGGGTARRLPPAGRARSGGARAHLRHHRQCRPLVVCAGRRPRARRRILRQQPRAQAHRRDDRHGNTIMAGDLSRAAADRRHRRRARSARGKSQRHARAHRGADARAQRSLRQYRPRSEDAAHPHAQSLPSRRCAPPGAKPTTAPRSNRRSPNPTS